MNDDIRGVVGYFPGPDEIRDGLVLVEEKQPHATAYLPIPDQPAVDNIMPGVSPVRWVSLVGGLSGIATALAMTIWMSWDYPLVVGGKPITSIPPFMVVCFELLILFGAICTLIGFLFFSKLPDLTPSEAYRPGMAVDQYAVFVPCGTEQQLASAEMTLREAGATEIAVVHDRQRGRLQVVK
jgi:hypothetical protein